MEKRYFHKDGHAIWAKLSVALVRDERGTPLHFVSHIEDITRAKAAESALREGRRLLDESQSVAGVGSWTWNLENGEPAWSVQQYLLHGVSPLSDAPALDQFLELVHPEDRERVRTKIFDIVRKREPFVDEYRVALGGSRVRTLSVRGDYLAADPSVGLPPRIAGTAQDVTAERAAPIGREETENRQRVLLSSLPDTMVVLYDRELRCRFVQGALMKELGVERDAFEGKLLSELVTPARLETLEPAIHRALTGESGSLEYGAGDGRTYAVDIAPYRSEDRSITGAFSVWRDISQRRRMDDELRASREKALEASRLKSEFVANMSHEIRTPLNGVVSMAELLLDTPLNGEQSQYAQVAMTSAEALMRVINDILDFSKIEAGKLEIVREDFSLARRGRRRGRDRRRQGGRARPRPRGVGGPRGRPGHHRGRQPGAPGADEPALQRGEVHLGGRGDRHGRAASTAPATTSGCASRSPTPGSGSTPRSWPRCSSPSRRPTPPPRVATAAPAWACASPSSWWS